jgi:nitrate/TMAO reductase-like tetraheme cytochrome c subunit
MREKTPHLASNPITMLGGFFALVAFGGLVFFLGVQALKVEPSPYIGLVVYMVLPVALAIGLVLVPAGMAWEARRRAKAAQRGLGVPPALVIDFGNPGHLAGVTLFATVTIVILGVFGATGYGAVEFMDSPSFCGTTCHTVMEPQYEPYKRSAHAEVNCTACHIGPGASWYVQSKLSGVTQLFAIVRDTYPRPIPAPIDHLRPARDTCEGCHWREKAYGMFLRVYRTYLPDESNTQHLRALAFRVGTGGEEVEEAGGVHWHTAAKVYYRTVDEERQEMATVRVETDSGVETWTNPNVKPGTALQPERLMDCIDCHNRAAHKIPAPDQLVDEALTSGGLDAELPYLKREALRLLGQDESQPTAAELVSRWSSDMWFEQLAEFYKTNYPSIAESHADSIQKAIDQLKIISGQVAYPDMLTTWLTYSDNRGHPGLEGVNRGCFRCHTTLVKADDGERLPGGVGGSGCLACHNLGEKGAEQLGGDTINSPECAYCHVSIPVDEIERHLPDPYTD